VKQVQCSNCEAGTFSNAINADKCTDCPFGYFQGAPGKSECITSSCNPGTKLIDEIPRVKQGQCGNCEAGTFSNTINAGECKKHTACNTQVAGSTTSDVVCVVSERQKQYPTVLGRLDVCGSQDPSKDPANPLWLNDHNNYEFGWKEGNAGWGWYSGSGDYHIIFKRFCKGSPLFESNYCNLPGDGIAGYFGSAFCDKGDGS
jgi:hypothetical protein